MPSSDLPVAQAKADLFKAIGHPLRIRILEQLTTGERSVGALADALGAEVPAISQQLAVLRRANVVVPRRAGSSIHYSLRDAGMAELLALARSMIVAGLRDSHALLAELETPADAARS